MTETSKKNTSISGNTAQESVCKITDIMDDLGKAADFYDQETEIIEKVRGLIYISPEVINVSPREHFRNSLTNAGFPEDVAEEVSLLAPDRIFKDSRLMKEWLDAAATLARAETLLVDSTASSRATTETTRALSHTEATAPAPLPQKELYKGKKQSGDPVAFLKRVWEDQLKTGEFTQAELRKHDPKLLQALRDHAPNELRDLIQPSQRGPRPREISDALAAQKFRAERAKQRKRQSEHEARKRNLKKT